MSEVLICLLFAAGAISASRGLFTQDQYCKHELKLMWFAIGGFVAMVAAIFFSMNL